MCGLSWLEWTWGSSVYGWSGLGWSGLESWYMTWGSMLVLLFVRSGIEVSVFSRFLYLFSVLFHRFFSSIHWSCWLGLASLPLLDFDVAMICGACVVGLIKLVSIKLLGSLLAIISYKFSFVSPASKLKIWMDGGYGLRVLKVRKEQLVSMSDVADCCVRVEVSIVCRSAVCLAFSLKLYIGVLCFVFVFFVPWVFVALFDFL